MASEESEYAQINFGFTATINFSKKNQKKQQQHKQKQNHDKLLIKAGGWPERDGTIDEIKEIK